MTALVARLRDGWGLAFLRVVLGYGFVAHGVAKLGRGPEHFAAVLDALGVPWPDATAWLTTLVELVGGIALILGVATELVAIPLVIVMVTAMVTVHLPNGFSSIKLLAIGPDGARFGKPGYELTLLYIAGLLALVLSPPTPLSIDRLRARRDRNLPPRQT